MTTMLWSLAGLGFLWALTRWYQTPRYRCGHCGTANGDHGPNCPWRRR